MDERWRDWRKEWKGDDDAQKVEGGGKEWEENDDEWKVEEGRIGMSGAEEGEDEERIPYNQPDRY